ncbi:alpha-ketoglutarate-dependent dioxygenase alkB homolog 7, mitochondrial-like [Ctenocephalides felis]|uniref:alpha-ketoglutarate-dependent dioxygenase alkB homolog 7, mitochondrial-like n=1 Tax=Ctenocephalides felis TaxID=7515 RepID=UPI000E6E43FF|nr:alpha-ketoglutarate-dependent dioxygenase alkB homolog 7, mitochondrial-like [Ctenocephalides felis]XP_026474203.1 alpha-ketoglutarate-dependent dioxygenase alkB homolog 7, mitochondrial-like [Ctenocephalides felis]
MQMIINQVVRKTVSVTHKIFTTYNCRNLSIINKKSQPNKQVLDKHDIKLPEYMELYYFEEDKIDLLHSMISNMIVLKEFVTPQEEENLMNELEPLLKKRRYEFDHWDNAIHGFREIEHKKWNSDNDKILQRVRDVAFDKKSVENVLEHVHVLDLSKDGKINPHVDSIRFCGHTIAGLSLISNSVMRLTRAVSEDSNMTADDETKVLAVNVYLERRSLYIMRNVARYDFAHEILGSDKSLFKNNVVTRDRRISVICRNHP